MKSAELEGAQPQPQLPELPKPAHTVWDDYYEGYVLSPTPEDRYHDDNGAVLLWSEHQVIEYGQQCYEAGVIAERERCAKVCESAARERMSGLQGSRIARECAAAISKGD